MRAEDPLEKWLKKYGKVIDRVFFSKGLEMGIVMGLIFVGLMNLVKPLVDAAGSIPSGAAMVLSGAGYIALKRLLLDRERRGEGRYGRSDAEPHQEPDP